MPDCWTEVAEVVLKEAHPDNGGKAQFFMSSGSRAISRSS
jgi:hypothetical protein